MQQQGCFFLNHIFGPGAAVRREINMHVLSGIMKANIKALLAERLDSVHLEPIKGGTLLLSCGGEKERDGGMERERQKREKERKRLRETL